MLRMFERYAQQRLIVSAVGDWQSRDRIAGAGTRSV